MAFSLFAVARWVRADTKRTKRTRLDNIFCRTRMAGKSSQITETGCRRRLILRVIHKRLPCALRMSDHEEMGGFPKKAKVKKMKLKINMFTPLLVPQLAAV